MGVCRVVYMGAYPKGEEESERQGKEITHKQKRLMTIKEPRETAKDNARNNDKTCRRPPALRHVLLLLIHYPQHLRAVLK